MFSQVLVAGPKYITFVDLKILKLVSWLEATIQKVFWETNTSKILRNFKK